jgi:hypothetical protein
MSTLDRLNEALAGKVLDAADETRAEALRRLAEAIDDIDTDRKSLAGLVREFMAGLDVLVPKESDARNADWTAAAAGGGSLLAVVRNAEEPATPNPRPSRGRNSKQAG